MLNEGTSGNLIFKTSCKRLQITSGRVLFETISFFLMKFSSIFYRFVLTACPNHMERPM